VPGSTTCRTAETASLLDSPWVIDAGTAPSCTSRTRFRPAVGTSSVRPRDNTAPDQDAASSFRVRSTPTAGSSVAASLEIRGTTSSPGVVS
jgi:hypothetical protein